MTTKHLKMKNDGRDGERFEAFLKRVVNVPKKEIDARDRAAKEKKSDSGRKPVNG